MSALTMHPFKYDVSFRIRHPTMDPDDISNELGLRPERNWKVGSQRTTPKGDILKGVYKETYCCFHLPHLKNQGLADFLKKIGKKFEIHSEFFKRILSTGGTLEFFIGWYSSENSGEEFDWKILAKLAELQINLSLDFYGGIDKPAKQT